MHKEKYVNAIVEKLRQNDCDVEATGEFLIDCLNDAVEVYTTRYQKRKDAEEVVNHIVEFINNYYPEIDAEINVDEFINSFDDIIDERYTPEAPREEAEEVEMTLDDFLREMGW